MFRKKTRGEWEMSGRQGAVFLLIGSMEVKEEREEKRSKEQGGEIDLASEEMTADEGLS